MAEMEVRESRSGAAPQARELLVALAQALAARRLYGADHPRTQASLGVVILAVEDLMAAGGPMRFTFLGPEIIHGNAPLRGAVPSEWTARLSEAGVQRLEFLDRPGRGEVARFLERLDEVLRRGWQADEGRESAGSAQGSRSAIAWGPVRPRDEVDTRTRADARRPEGTPGAGEISLAEEVEAVTWIWNRIREGSRFPLAEAEGVIRSLGVLLRALPPGTVPRIRESPLLDYAHTHALHTALLALGWARDLALPPSEAMGLGLSGLFHDVGLLLADPDGRHLAHPGPLDEHGVLAVRSHPTLGAKLLVEAGAPLALAATVAFEHHMGTGPEAYPASGSGRGPHPAARLIQLLSTWDALRSTRPHRAALSRDAALLVLAEGAEEGWVPVELLTRFTGLVEEVEARGGGESPGDHPSGGAATASDHASR